MVAEVTGTLKLADQVKLDASVGAEQVKFNEFLGTASKIITGGVAGLNLTYQPDNWNKFNLKAETSSNSQIISGRYAHKIGNGVEAFVEVSNTKNTG